jgi:uncharacterized hydrophobic protein (TIGR00271 family)
VKQLEMQLAEPAREELYRSILESSHLDLEYVAMLGFSGLIALFGLLQNSVAVIIGAMLISPLMNPILAGALALILGDWSLGRRAASVLGWSIGGVIALTWLVAWLTPLKQVTPEILARTNPNLLDLLVAVLAGLAGTLALRGGPVGLTIIPGVAIAVAVIPPLAVVGFSLSTYHGTMAWGGFLLFVTNLVSIMISAAVVFRLMGFVPHGGAEEGRAKLRRRMAVSALVLVILAVPLVQTLRRAVVQIGVRTEVKEVIDSVFKTGHSTIAELSYAQVGKGFQVNVTVRTTQYFETSEIEAAQTALRKRFGPNAQLTVDQILVAQGGLTAEQMARIRDFISGGVVHPVAKEEQFDLRAAQERITTYLQKQVDEVLSGTEIRRAGPLRAGLGPDSPVLLNLRLVAPEPLEGQTLKVLATQLAAKISTPVELHGQVELTGQGYALNVQSAEARRRLGRDDREALAKLLDVLAPHADLRLAVEVSAAGLNADAIKKFPLWRDAHYLLARSRLKGTQWKMDAEAAAPPAATPAVTGAAPEDNKAPAPAAPGPIRATFRVTQVF